MIERDIKPSSNLHPRSSTRQPYATMYGAQCPITQSSRVGDTHQALFPRTRQGERNASPRPQNSLHTSSTPHPIEPVGKGPAGKKQQLRGLTILSSVDCVYPNFGRLQRGYAFVDFGAQLRCYWPFLLEKSDIYGTGCTNLAVSHTSVTRAHAPMQLNCSSMRSSPCMQQIG